MGIGKEISNAIYKLVIENNKKEAGALVATEIDKQSDGKLPA